MWREPDLSEHRVCRPSDIPAGTNFEWEDGAFPAIEFYEIRQGDVSGTLADVSRFHGFFTRGCQFQQKNGLRIGRPYNNIWSFICYTAYLGWKYDGQVVKIYH